MRVKAPSCLRNLEVYDQVVVGSAFGTEDIVQQLKGLGVPPEKIDTAYAELLAPVLFEKNAVIQGKNESIKQRNETIKQKNEIIKEKNTLIKKLHLYDGFQLCAGKYKEEEYESRWREIKKKYDCVKIFQVRGAGSIGEIIPRYCAIRRNEPAEDLNVLRVFLMFPDSSWPRPRLCNKELIRLFNQHIYAPQGEDALFWYHVYRYHFDELDCLEIEKYLGRNLDPPYVVESDHHEFALTGDEVRFAEARIKEMRLKKDYVCVAARTGAYNLATRGWDGNINSRGKILHHDFRNTDFNAYLDAIHYLEDQGIQAVRMGRGESALASPINNCVDYAGRYASDLMDLYLVAHCKFMLITTTGLFTLASLFGKPLVVVNAVPVSCLYGENPYTKNDIYLPKKYYDIHKKRYLSFMEIIEIEQECILEGSKYEEAGIRFEDNTPEEIREAVAEFLGRLNGTWEDTKEDMVNYERYKQLHYKMGEIAAITRRHTLGGPIPYRPAATYLRKNQYLLQA